MVIKALPLKTVLRQPLPLTMRSQIENSTDAVSVSPSPSGSDAQPTPAQIARRTAREAVIQSPFERAALDVDLDVKPNRFDPPAIRDLRSVASQLDARIEAQQQAEAVMSVAVDVPDQTTPLADALAQACPQSYRERYIYVAHLDRVFDLVTRRLFTTLAVCRMLDGIQPKDVAIQAFILKGATAIRKVDATGYFPGQALIVERLGARHLNTWTPLDFGPMEGDVTPFLAHLAYLFDGGNELVEFVLNWVAHLVQHPETKLATAILLTSAAEGIGKGVLVKMLAVLVGTGNTRFLNAEAIGSDFNDWLTSSTLVIVEEFEDTGRAGFKSKLKGYVTDHEADINAKHVPRFKAENVANFFFSANDAAPLTLSDSDRRFVVHRSRAVPKNESYYADLVTWFDREGRQFVLNLLLTRDLSDFNPHARGPVTDAHHDLVANGRDSQTAYLHEAFDAQEPPFACDLVVIKHVVDHVNSVGRIRLTTRIVEDFLRSIGALRLTGQYRLNHHLKTRNYFWVIRNPDPWAGDVTVEQVRQFYVHPDDQTNGLYSGDLNRVPSSDASMALAVQPRRRLAAVAN